MGNNARRRNEGLLLWLRAAAIAAATYGGLVGLQFSPPWGAALLASLAGVAALGSADLGVIVAVVSLALPIAAANPVFGIVFLVLGLVGVRYLGADGGRAFLIVAASVAGAFFGPVWAAVAVAGYLMSTGSAAMAAAVACLVVEIAGVALGSAVRLSAATIGSGARPILDLAKAPESLFSVEWIAKSFGAIDAKMVDGVIASATGIRYPLAFVLQPAIWAGGAAVTAMLVREARRRKSQPLLYGAVAAGTLVTAAGVARARLGRRAQARLGRRLAGDCELARRWRSGSLCCSSSCSRSSLRPPKRWSRVRAPWPPRMPTSTSCCDSLPRARRSSRRITPPRRWS